MRIFTNVTRFVLIMFMFLSINLTAYGIGTLSGVDDPCPGTPYSYQLELTGDDCLFIILQVYVVNGTCNTTTPTSSNVISVTWDNNTSSVVEGEVYVAYTYKEDPCGRTDPINSTVSLTLDVDIQPGTVNVGNASTPAAPSISYGRWRFSSSATNATSYEWDVTGGTIYGSQTGSTIDVNATSSSCQVKARARGKATTSCGVTDYGSWSSWRTKNLSTPSQPGSISGPEEINNYDITEYSVSAVTDATHYAWSLSYSAGNYIRFNGDYSNSPYHGSSGYNASVVFSTNYTVVELRTLYVSAKNSCGTSTARSKSIWLNKPYGPIMMGGTG